MQQVVLTNVIIQEIFNFSKLFIKKNNCGYKTALPRNLSKFSMVYFIFMVGCDNKYKKNYYKTEKEWN